MVAAASRALLGVVVVAAAASCSEGPPPDPFPISVKVEADPGKPIANAIVARGTRVSATTNAEGVAMLRINGVEGEITDITVTCPDGYTSPARPINIRLTRLAEKGKVPQYGVSCPPAMRRVVVAIRAENGPYLPVMYLDRPVTRTDSAGAASFALEVPAGAQFIVTLDTNERKDLKPQSPAKRFVVSQQDDVFLFDQRFDVEKKR